MSEIKVEPPKRGRGRPKKNAVVQPVQQISTSTNEVLKRKPGRPRKHPIVAQQAQQIVSESSIPCQEYDVIEASIAYQQQHVPIIAEIQPFPDVDQNIELVDIEENQQNENTEEISAEQIQHSVDTEFNRTSRAGGEEDEYVQQSYLDVVELSEVCPQTYSLEEELPGLLVQSYVIASYSQQQDEQKQEDTRHQTSTNEYMKSSSNETDQTSTKIADPITSTNHAIESDQSQIASNTVDSNDLLCTICMEYPTTKIWQCHQGHLLCEICWQSLVKSTPKCPICRVDLNCQNPIRARFQEQILSGMIVSCKFVSNGCGTRLKFRDLIKHTTTCSFRNIDCDYKPLGCHWNGLAFQKDQHIHACPVSSKSLADISEHVRQLTLSFDKRMAGLLPYKKFLEDSAICQQTFAIGSNSRYAENGHAFTFQSRLGVSCNDTSINISMVGLHRNCIVDISTQNLFLDSINSNHVFVIDGCEQSYFIGNHPCYRSSFDVPITQELYEDLIIHKTFRLKLWLSK